MNDAEISIESLSLPQKMSLMERLWVDLSQSPDGAAIPDWHEAVLAKRLEALERGEVELIPWEDVKKRLQKRYE